MQVDYLITLKNKNVTVRLKDSQAELLTKLKDCGDGQFLTLEKPRVMVQQRDPQNPNNIITGLVPFTMFGKGETIVLKQEDVLFVDELSTEFNQIYIQETTGLTLNNPTIIKE